MGFPSTSFNTKPIDGALDVATKHINTYNFYGIEFRVEVWMAIVVVFLVFLLIMTFARLRREYVGWSFKGFFPALLIGIIMTLVFEGFFVLSGKTILTRMFGWENAPKPISTFLDESRGELVDVLGASETSGVDYESIIKDFNKMDSQDKEQVREYMCK